jgi:hypothetical protein
MVRRRFAPLLRGVGWASGDEANTAGDQRDAEPAQRADLCKMKRATSPSRTYSSEVAGNT